MGVGGHKRFLVMIGFVLCLCGFARPALAAPKVGKVVNGSGDSATVDAQVIGSGISNGFSAAAWSFGVDPASLTAEQKAKLSNESTGGAFYRYAMAFQSGAHEPLTVGLSSWYSITLPQFVWTVEGYPYGDYTQARRDLKTIRDGGDLGGGGGGSGDVSFSGTASLFINSSSGTSSNYWTYGGKRYYMSHSLTESQVNNGYEKMESLRYTFALPTSGSNVSRIPDDLTGWNCCIFITRYNSTSARFRALFYRKDLVTVSTISDPYTGSLFPNTFSSDAVNPSSGKYTVTFDVGGSAAFNPAGVDFTNASDLSVGSYNASAEGGYTPPNMGTSLRTSIAGPPVVPPNNNWPDDDPTPTPDPPEVPGPSDDPIPQPDPPDLPNPVSYPVSDPYTPDPDPPTNPVITYDPDPSGEFIDYRPWLNLILKLLRTINTTIDNGFYDVDVWLTEHCDHIRQMMHNEALTLGLKMQAAINNGFVSFERWLQSTYGPYFFEELDATLRAILADYEDYLYDLFVWLSEQFDFSVSGGAGSYDDSTLLYWLQQIWAILAEKPSVGTEPDSFFDWLANLLAGILGGLVAWLLGALGGMADAVSGLATKFPFSLPWDIATMLALFVHEPVTPVFDLPFALPGEYANVRVDMSYFDEVMAAVRGVELVLFGLALAKRTPDMLELADTVFS